MAQRTYLSEWVDSAYSIAVEDEKLDKDQLQFNEYQHEAEEYKVLTIGQSLFALSAKATFEDISVEIKSKYGFEASASEDMARFTETLLFCACHDDVYGGAIKNSSVQLISYIQELIQVYMKAITDPDDVSAEIDDESKTYGADIAMVSLGSKETEAYCNRCVANETIVSSLRQEIEEFKEQDKNTMNAIEQLQEALNSEMNRTIDAEIRISEKNDTIALLNEELEDAQHKILNLDMKIYDIEEKFAKRAKDAKKSHFLMKENKKFMEQIRLLTEELETMRSKEERFDNAENQLENLRRRLVDYQEMKQELAKISSLYQELFAQYEAYEKEVESLRKLQVLVDQFKDELSDTQSANAKLQAKATEQVEELAKLRAENTDLQTGEEERLLQIQMLEKELKHTQELLRNAELGKNGGHGLNEDLSAKLSGEVEELKNEYEKSLQRVNALKERLREQEEESANKIKELEEEVADSREKINTLHTELQEKHMDLLASDQQVHAYKAKEDEQQRERDELLEQMSEKDLKIAELLGQLEQKLSEMSSTDQEAFAKEQALKDELLLAEKKETALTKKVADLEAQLNAMQEGNAKEAAEQLLEAQKRLQEALDRIDSINEALERSEKSLAEAQEKNTSLAEEKGSLEEKGKSSDEEHKKALEDADAVAAALREQLAAATKQASELQNELNARDGRLNDSEQAALERQNAAAAALAERDAMEAEMKRKMAAMESELAKLRAAAAQNEGASLDREKELEEALAKMKAENDTLHADIEDKHYKLLEHDQAALARQKELDALNAKLKDMDEKAEKIKAENFNRWNDIIGKQRGDEEEKAELARLKEAQEKSLARSKLQSFYRKNGGKNMVGLPVEFGKVGFVRMSASESAGDAVDPNGGKNVDALDFAPKEKLISQAALDAAQSELEAAKRTEKRAIRTTHTVTKKRIAESRRTYTAAAALADDQAKLLDSYLEKRKRVEENNSPFESVKSRAAGADKQEAKKVGVDRMNDKDAFIEKADEAGKVRCAKEDKADTAGATREQHEAALAAAKADKNEELTKSSAYMQKVYEEEEDTNLAEARVKASEELEALVKATEAALAAATAFAKAKKCAEDEADMIDAAATQKRLHDATQELASADDFAAHQGRLLNAAMQKSKAGGGSGGDDNADDEKAQYENDQSRAAKKARLAAEARAKATETEREEAESRARAARRARDAEEAKIDAAAAAMAEQQQRASAAAAAGDKNAEEAAWEAFAALAAAEAAARAAMHQCDKDEIAAMNDAIKASNTNARELASAHAALDEEADIIATAEALANMQFQIGEETEALVYASARQRANAAAKALASAEEHVEEMIAAFSEAKERADEKDAGEETEKTRAANKAVEDALERAEAAAEAKEDAEVRAVAAAKERELQEANAKEAAEKIAAVQARRLEALKSNDKEAEAAATAEIQALTAAKATAMRIAREKLDEETAALSDARDAAELEAKEYHTAKDKVDEMALALSQAEVDARLRQAQKSLIASKSFADQQMQALIGAKERSARAGNDAFENKLSRQAKRAKEEAEVKAGTWVANCGEGEERAQIAGEKREAAEKELAAAAAAKAEYEKQAEAARQAASAATNKSVVSNGENKSSSSSGGVVDEEGAGAAASSVSAEELAAMAAARDCAADMQHAAKEVYKHAAEQEKALNAAKMCAYESARALAFAREKAEEEAVALAFGAARQRADRAVMELQVADMFVLEQEKALNTTKELFADTDVEAFDSDQSRAARRAREEAESKAQEATEERDAAERSAMKAAALRSEEEERAVRAAQSKAEHQNTAAAAVQSGDKAREEAANTSAAMIAAEEVRAIRAAYINTMEQERLLVAAKDAAYDTARHLGAARERAVEEHNALLAFGSMKEKAEEAARALEKADEFVAAQLAAYNAAKEKISAAGNQSFENDLSKAARKQREQKEQESDELGAERDKYEQMALECGRGREEQEAKALAAAVSKTEMQAEAITAASDNETAAEQAALDRMREYVLEEMEALRAAQQKVNEQEKAYIAAKNFAYERARVLTTARELSEKERDALKFGAAKHRAAQLSKELEKAEAFANEQASILEADKQKAASTGNSKFDTDKSREAKKACEAAEEEAAACVREKNFAKEKAQAAGKQRELEENKASAAAQAMQAYALKAYVVEEARAFNAACKKAEEQAAALDTAKNASFARARALGIAREKIAEGVEAQALAAARQRVIDAANALAEAEEFSRKQNAAFSEQSRSLESIQEKARELEESSSGKSNSGSDSRLEMSAEEKEHAAILEQAVHNAQQTAEEALKVKEEAKVRSKEAERSARMEETKAASAAVSAAEQQQDLQNITDKDALDVAIAAHHFEVAEAGRALLAARLLLEKQTKELELAKECSNEEARAWALAKEKAKESADSLSAHMSRLNMAGAVGSKDAILAAKQQELEQALAARRALDAELAALKREREATLSSREALLEQLQQLQKQHEDGMNDAVAASAKMIKHARDLLALLSENMRTEALLRKNLAELSGENKMNAQNRDELMASLAQNKSAGAALRSSLFESLAENKDAEQALRSGCFTSMEEQKRTEAAIQAVLELLESREDPLTSSEAILRDSLHRALQKNREKYESTKETAFKCYEEDQDIQRAVRDNLLKSLDLCNVTEDSLKKDLSKCGAARAKLENELLDSVAEVRKLRQALASGGGENGSMSADAKKKLDQAEKALMDSFAAQDELRRARAAEQAEYEAELQRLKDLLAQGGGGASNAELERRAKLAEDERHEMELKWLEATKELNKMKELLNTIQSGEAGSNAATLRQLAQAEQALFDAYQASDELQKARAADAEEHAAALAAQLAEFQKSTRLLTESHWAEMEAANKKSQAQMKQLLAELDAANQEIERLRALLANCTCGGRAPAPAGPTDPDVEAFLVGAKKDPDQEALEAAILLSMQQAQYGKSMMDITEEQEVLIGEYMEQGFTREEAMLIVFEDTHGKVEGQGVIRPALPSVHNKKLHANRKSMSGLGGGFNASSNNDMSSVGGYADSPLKPTTGKVGGASKFRRKESFVGDLNSVSLEGLQQNFTKFTRAEEAEISYIMSRGSSREEAISIFLKNHNARVTEGQASRRVAPPQPSTNVSPVRYGQNTLSPMSQNGGGASQYGYSPPPGSLYSGGGSTDGVRVMNRRGSAQELLSRDSYDDADRAQPGFNLSSKSGSSKYAGNAVGSSKYAGGNGNTNSNSNGNGAARFTNPMGSSAAAQLFRNAETGSQVSSASQQQSGAAPQGAPGASRYAGGASSSSGLTPSSKHHRIASQAPPSTGRY